MSKVNIWTSFNRFRPQINYTQIGFALLVSILALGYFTNQALTQTQQKIVQTLESLEALQSSQGLVLDSLSIPRAVVTLIDHENRFRVNRIFSSQNGNIRADLQLNMPTSTDLQATFAYINKLNWHFNVEAEPTAELLKEILLDSGLIALGILVIFSLYLKVRRSREDQKKAEYQSELALQVAHDIRSPLTALKIVSKSSAMDETTRSELLTSVSDKISEIAEDLLSMGRSKNERSKQDKSLVEVLNQVLTEKDLEWPSKAIRIEYKPEFHNVRCKVDRKSLTRTVSNLINNAAESTVDGAEIIVRLKDLPKKRMTIIEISDNGHGMDQTTIKSILTSRTRAANHSSKPNGNGIGLTSAKKFIESNGGELKISSQIGTGTTVSLILPNY